MDIREHLFIVFGEEHYNPLGAIRSLGEYGIKPIAIIIKSQYIIASSSKYIDKLIYVETIEEGYALIVKNYINLEHRTFIITCDDRITSFLDLRYEEIKDAFYLYNAGRKGKITFYLDKNNINELAMKHGINVPKARVINKNEIPEKVEYPVITKSISSNDGGWKDDVFICNDANELETALKKIKSNTILLQKFIDKKNELCLDGFSVNKGKDVFISIAASYNYIIPGQYSCDMTLSNFHNPELFKKIKAMLAEIEYEGIFCIEFLVEKNGNLSFLEVNFRNSGWSYASTSVGMNLPVLWAQGMLEHKVPEGSYKPISKGYRAIAEFPDFKIRVLGHRIGMLKWIKDIKKCNCFFIINKKDMKPFWTTVGSKIKTKLFGL